MLLKLTPDETNIRFMSARGVALAISGFLMLATIVLVFTKGLNFGVDFTGGIVIEIGAEEEIDLGTLRSGLGDMVDGEVAIQAFGTGTEALIRLPSMEGGAEAQKQATEAVQGKIEELIPGEVSYRRIEYVGPRVSSELVQGGIIAVAIAMLGSMIYIWMRFEWQFGIGAMLGLIHDVILTLGIWVVFQLEFNLSIIAAILTVVGYSLNDTVVVFDRVRENLRKYRKMDLDELIDLSINQTLARTIMTGVTSLLALVALYLFGGEVLEGFAIAMIFGIVVGTYSTVFVATPVLPWFNLRRDFGEEAEQRP